METVIAIPLFMTIIGATLWLGELALTRARLLLADRYAAWAGGNRHRPPADLGGDISARIFGDHPNQHVVRTEAPGSFVGTWYRKSRGRVYVQVTMPIWTRGWLDVGRVAWGSPGLSSALTFGAKEGGQPHLVIMRSGSRDQHGRLVDWNAVFDDSWP